ncbi:MAG: hypothetical protein IKZ96_03580 [Bacilli bacterium]|nr:hypothetical protein [Bacilli bacterium]
MGFLDKVKDFFYEDEDGTNDVVIKPDKPKKENPFKIREKKEEIVKREPVEEKTQRIDIEYEEEKTNSDLSERELFRSERTFNFPVDVDDEEEETSSGFTEQEKDEYFGPTSRLRFDEPVRKESSEELKTRFRPSPVISPVYGILDKDYNVDDVEEINKGDDHSLNKKISDYDTVRNKAYKEMDEELEKTLNERKSIFYNLDEKEEDVPISYGEENAEAKEVEIPETRVKKNKKVVEESESDEVKADTNELFNLLDNMESDEYDDDDE